MRILDLLRSKTPSCAKEHANIQPSHPVHFSGSMLKRIVTPFSQRFPALPYLHGFNDRKELGMLYLSIGEGNNSV